MKNIIVISGSKETAKKGVGGHVSISFDSKEDLQKKASEIVGIRWRYAASFENEDVIKDVQRLYDDSFDDVDDVVNFVYK